MNLEDKLRSHLQSGPDVIDGLSTTAADLTAAGQRRSRRNRAVMGGTAVLAAVVLIVGAGALIGDSSDRVDEVATGDIDGPAALNDAAEAPPLTEGAGDAQLFDAELAPDTVVPAPPPVFDWVVGGDNGFAGLRNRDGEIVALRSADGVTFSEEATSGIPGGSEFVELIAEDDIFVSAFRSVDQLWIGSSENLTDWDLVEVPFTDSTGMGLSLLDVDIDDGQVLVHTTPLNSADAEFVGQLLVGPVGGPYEQRSAPSGLISQVATLGDNQLVIAAVDGGIENVLLRSDRGGEWEPVAEIVQSSGLFLLSEIDDDLIAIGYSGLTFESTDQGNTFSAVDEIISSVDQDRSSASLVSGDSTVAVSIETWNDNDTPVRNLFIRSAGRWSPFDIDAAYDAQGVGPNDVVQLVAVNDEEVLIQLFPSSGQELGAAPIYLSIPIG